MAAKAIVVVISDADVVGLPTLCPVDNVERVADDVARLFAAALLVNGYRLTGDPAVIDWPVRALGS